MKKLTLLFVLLFAAGALRAQETGVFLKLPMSARGAGMGDAFTADASEPLGAFYNPAGIANAKQASASFVHHIYVQDIAGDSVGLVVPVGKYVLGVAPTSFKMKEEPVYDSFGTDTGRTFGYQSMIVPVAVARNFGLLSVGAGMKSYSEKIDGESSRTNTYDIGAQLRLKRLQFGFSSQNLGGKIFDCKLARVQRAGVVFNGSELSLAADVVKEGSFDNYFNIGAEVPLAEMFRLRGGMRLREEFGGPTFGLGLKLGRLSADYAFAGYGDLGSTHKMGLSYAFGAIEKKPVLRAEFSRIPNTAPALGWTGEENFFSAGLSTTSGNTGTDFAYRVKYFDADGDSPAAGYPKLHVLKGGADISGSPFAMDYISGENKSGAVYSLTKKLPAGNSYAYYFEARDARGAEAQGAPVSPPQFGPLVAQVEAEKMSGGLNMAIAEFTGKNVSQADASIVGDFLRTELVNTGLYNVMDRNNMDTILAEQKFQNSGCTEQQCAVEMGKLLNVQKMLVGSLSKLLDTYYVTVNVIDVETGKISASYDVDAANAKGLKEACQRIVAKIAGK